MKLIICIFIAILFFGLLQKQIKKYSGYFYLGTLFVTILGIVLAHFTVPAWIDYGLKQILQRGVLATAMYVLVMYAILMPKGSAIQKLLMSLRGEMAIMASLLILEHNLCYGRIYFRALFVNAGRLSTREILAAVLSLCMIVLLIPLTITSFKCIRKKMNAKKWKQLQRWSYLFYALMYAHVAVLYSSQIVNSNVTYLIDFCIYTIIFGVYAVLRVSKYLEKEKQTGMIRPVKGAGAVVMFLIIAFTWFPMFSKDEAKEVANTEMETAYVTAEVTEHEVELMGEANAYQDGTYTGEGEGFNGPITVEVTVEGGEITAIRIIERTDDEEYFSRARDGIIPEMIEKQVTEVDTVSGATFSSKGILTAVKNALAQAN